jgi:hypothetical protein
MADGLAPPQKTMMGLKTLSMLRDVSVRTLHRWIKSGLPHFRQGPRTKILVRPEDIEEFLQRHQHNHIDLDAVVKETAEALLCQKPKRSDRRSRS